jgi:ribosome maturation factor RimP
LAHFLFQMKKEDLIELLEPTVNDLGYELVDLDLREGRGGLVRLFIDKDPAVTLADCEYVSGQVGDLLDVEDPLPGGYVLEVSSPGLDRRLRTPDHFAAAVGSEIRVELKRAVDGRRRFRGHLIAADAAGIEIEGDGNRWQLPLAEVSTARVVPTD